MMYFSVSDTGKNGIKEIPVFGIGLGFKINLGIIMCSLMSHPMCTGPLMIPGPEMIPKLNYK